MLRLNFNKNLINPENLYLTLRLNKTTSAWDLTEEYQYIQKSKVPTMHFQPSLPRLPIPKLEDTCNRYLNAQNPILNEDQLKNTSRCLNQFLTKDGPRLQKLLTEKNNKNRHTSYISEPWFDMYLRDRKPIPINYNPFLVFVDEEKPEYNNQLVKTTNIIVSSLRFMRSLRAGILAPEVYHLNPKKSDTNLFRTVTKLMPSSLSWYAAYLFKAFPLDMSQYHNLFNSTRIPELGKDRIFQDTSARHVVVQRKGNFYTFNVLDENGYILEPKQIASCLKSILESNRAAAEYPIGILTTTERDEWAQIRSHLTDLGNKETLNKIDTALFAINLDDIEINNNKNALLRNYLHADGTNRWFDKSFSLITSKDGHAGINFEHSWGDGVAVLRYFQDIKKDISLKPTFHPQDVKTLNNGLDYIQKLDFNLDSRAQNAIRNAQKKYKSWTDNLCIDHLIIEGFGKKECKGFKVSPDAIMQLAFQLAYYRMEGCSVPTYESCSTAAFKHGRTETMRPCTLQTKAVCAALTSKKSTISNSELQKMIVDCSNAHSILTKDAAMGQGFDRHLFALNRICDETNQSKPEIFQDPAYEYINHNILSTSTLSSAAVAAGGFGAVVSDGYGIGYMIQDKTLGAVVTSYRDHHDASDYIKSLDEAFKILRKTLMHN